ncbi:MAG: hypothetical protein ACI82J_000467 [Sulfitobacter litoralis]|jgi:hypothetical protein|tara:strand:- start:766 stop:888 length:123 start_codon:yes stop_codon:yes gene_type:complete
MKPNLVKKRTAGAPLDLSAARHHAPKPMNFGKTYDEQVNI